MIQSNDTKTREICEMDLAGPVPARPTKRELAAAREAKFRTSNGVRSLTVNLPVDLLAEFDAWASAKGANKSATIAKLIRSQLLRKR